ncbi:transcription factor AP-1-like [Actinia tenebrosa]|uniref:Transcription factor AP-1-like n=1 Tax=Actinia tenebrosa TaxID=6105 RepID=A0A6P8HBD3_ACTTE|nr:transcription factor AP-1-like [Actinia tenebrosa]
MGDHVYRSYDNMDVLFYEQQTPTQSGGNFNKYDKSAMRLNLRPTQLTGQENHRPINGKSATGMFHHSPDMGIFKMVSPELERFIGSNTGLTPKGNPVQPSSPEFPLFSLVSPEFEKILASIQNKTPTPTRILREGNSVAKQREVYVQGFAEALQHIHDQQQHTHLEHGNNEHVKIQYQQQQMSVPGTVSYGWTDRRQDSHQNYESMSKENPQCDMEAMHYVSSVEPSEDSQNALDSTYNQMEQINEPNEHKLDETPLRRNQNLNVLPLPPIDLELQEIVKRERKKQKNRVAASKCRRKKLEREAQLEVRVQQLKEKNIELNAVASALRQQVGELKQRVLEHVAFGCQLPTVTTAAY